MHDLPTAAEVGQLSERWAPPVWMDVAGAWSSIAMLLLLGITNLRTVLRTAPGRLVPLVGIKGPWLARLLPAHNRLSAAAVGALFAPSFDTISQSVLFAATAARFGGLFHALALGGPIVVGMLAPDGLNGWWISRLIARADEVAAITSRVMGLAVSGASLLVAALGVGTLLSPAIEGWTDGKEGVFGAIVVLVVALSYLLARSLAVGSFSRIRTA